MTVRKLISVEYMGRFMDFEQRALLDKGSGSGTPAAGNGDFVENRKPRFTAGSWPFAAGLSVRRIEALSDGLGWRGRNDSE